jgi:hypothetical protein
MLGAHWIMLPEFLSAQGYAMHRHLLGHADYLRKFYCGEGNGRVDAHPIDEGITYMMNIANHRRTGDGYYGHARGSLTRAQDVPTEVSYAFPSIVEHRDGPTIIVHRDGPRNGTTALMTADCDPSGAALPEIRKAWVFGPHSNWDSSAVHLEDIVGKLKETTNGQVHRVQSGRPEGADSGREGRVVAAESK